MDKSLSGNYQLLSNKVVLSQSFGNYTLKAQCQPPPPPPTPTLKKSNINLQDQILIMKHSQQLLVNMNCLMKHHVLILN